jgi:hypothetical protein
MRKKGEIIQEVKDEYIIMMKRKYGMRVHISKLLGRELEEWEQEQWDWYQARQSRHPKGIKPQIEKIMQILQEGDTRGKIAEIERELDKTDIREIPPCHNERRRLRRQKMKAQLSHGLIMGIKPEPPTPKKERKQVIAENQYKRSIKRILGELESPMEKKWKQRNFERESYLEW